MKTRKSEVRVTRRQAERKETRLETFMFDGISSGCASIYKVEKFDYRSGNVHYDYATFRVGAIWDDPVRGQYGRRGTVTAVSVLFFPLDRLERRRP